MFNSFIVNRRKGQRSARCVFHCVHGVNSAQGMSGITLVIRDKPCSLYIVGVDLAVELRLSDAFLNRGRFYDSLMGCSVA
jgi:hypothetical protein